MSNSQLQSGLEAAGVGEIVATELNSIYSVVRTDAFKAGVSLLIYGSLLGLVFSLWLSKRKLVVKGSCTCRITACRVLARVMLISAVFELDYLSNFLDLFLINLFTHFLC